MLSSAQKIFIYNMQKENPWLLPDFLNSSSCKTFTTHNLYQLHQYAREIAPDIMLLHLDKTNEYIPFSDTSVNQLSAYPIIITKPQGQNFVQRSYIAHYLHLPDDLHTLNDILESYTLGHKNHDILLLSSFRNKPCLLQQHIYQSPYTYFETHTFQAAQRYLQKNQPKIICIEYSLPFIIARHTITHDHVFYVDSTQDITEFEKFLN